MLSDEASEYLEQRLDEIDSLDELQAYIAATSSQFQDPPSEPVDTVGEERVMGGLENWLSRLRSKLELLAREEGAEEYELAVSGGTAGLSVTVSVTHSVHDTENE